MISSHFVVVEDVKARGHQSVWKQQKHDMQNYRNMQIGQKIWCLSGKSPAANVRFA